MTTTLPRPTPALAPVPVSAPTAPRIWACLYCGTPCHPRSWRGCCSPTCARLEHDAEPDNDFDPED